MAIWQNSLWGNWPGYTDDFPWYLATEKNAVGLPVVGGFLNILTSLVLQMPIHGFREQPDGPPVPMPADPAVIRNPAPGGSRTLGDFVSEYVRDVFLHGNYVAILGDPDWTGWPDTLYPVPFDQWEIITDGPRFGYRVGGNVYDPSEVFHVRRNCKTGQLVGTGFLADYPGLIASSVAAEQWAAQYFNGGAVPPATITHPNPELTQSQADELKGKWRNAVRRREAVVVPAGTDVRSVSSNADEAQLEQTRRTNSQALAMAVGIPGALLGLDAPSLTYRNINDVFQQFVTTTVMGYLAPLEQQLTLQCLPRGNSAKFITSAVLRPDLAQRVTIATQGLAGGVFTSDEARALVDLPPTDPDPTATSVEPPATGPVIPTAPTGNLAVIQGGN